MPDEHRPHDPRKPTPPAPAPKPTPTPAPTPVAGAVLLEDDFATLDLTKWQPQGAAGRWNVVADATFGHAMALTCADSDISAPVEPPSNHVSTSNPATCLLSTLAMPVGEDFYIGLHVQFPSPIPVVNQAKGGWFQWLEIYGPPYGGSPPFGMMIVNTEADPTHNHVAVARDEAHNYDMPWINADALTYGVWHELWLHGVLSTDPTVGLWEVWWNGEQVMDLNYATLGPTNDVGPNVLYLSDYRLKGMIPGEVVVEFAHVVVATTLDEVTTT